MFYVVSFFENQRLDRQVWAKQPNDDAVIEHVAAIMDVAPALTLATITEVESLCDYRDVAIITSRPLTGASQDDAFDSDPKTNALA